MTYLALPSELTRGSLARAEQINDRMSLISSAFGKLPTERELKQSKVNIGVDSGGADAYVITQPYPIVAYEDGDLFRFIALNPNTGPSVVNVDAVGPLPATRANGDPLQGGDIAGNGALTEARYSAASNTLRIQGASAADLAATTAQAVAAAASAASSAGFATASQASATAAAASVVQAANSAASLNGTSTTSLLIGTGSKAFTTQAGKQYATGAFVMIVSAANVANYMFGQVAAYSGTSLTVTVGVVGGSGTYADWIISVAGHRGADGPPGATGSGSGNVSGPGSSTVGNVPAFGNTTGDVLTDSGFAYTVALQALSTITPAADRVPYFTGAGTAGLAALTSFSRSFLQNTTAITARSTLGLIIGTDVQAFDADLAAIAGLTSAADKLPYFTGSAAAALATFTAKARSLVACVDEAAMRTFLGVGSSGILRGWISPDFAFSNNVATPNTKIDYSAGQLVDDANAVTMSCAGGTINLGATGADGLDTGVIASSTPYWLFIISNGTLVKGLASLARTAPTMPGGYTIKRRCGAFYVDSSGHVLPFTQVGRWFYFDAPPNIKSGVAINATPQTIALSPLPTGKRWPVQLRLVATGTTVNLWPSDRPDQAPSFSFANDAQGAGGGFTDSARLFLATDILSQLEGAAVSGGGSYSLGLFAFKDDGL